MDRNLHLLGDCVDFTNLAYSCRHGLSSVDSLALSLCSNQSNSIVCFVRQLFVFLQNCNDSHILDHLLRSHIILRSFISMVEKTMEVNQFSLQVSTQLFRSSVAQIKPLSAVFNLIHAFSFFFFLLFQIVLYFYNFLLLVTRL
jgi:hypothetical protein